MFYYYDRYFRGFVYFVFLLQGFKVSKALLLFLYSDIKCIKAELPIDVWTILMYDCSAFWLGFYMWASVYRRNHMEPNSFCLPFFFVLMFGKKKQATLLKAVPAILSELVNSNKNGFGGLHVNKTESRLYRPNQLREV